MLHPHEPKSTELPTDFFICKSPNLEINKQFFRLNSYFTGAQMSDTKQNGTSNFVLWQPSLFRPYLSLPIVEKDFHSGQTK